MAIGANNLLMLALSNYRRKLFDLQTFQNQAHIISVTGIIIYFLGTYYLYTLWEVAPCARWRSSNSLQVLTQTAICNHYNAKHHTWYINACRKLHWVQVLPGVQIVSKADHKPHANWDWWKYNFWGIRFASLFALTDYIYAYFKLEMYKKLPYT